MTSKRDVLWTFSVSYLSGFCLGQKATWVMGALDWVCLERGRYLSIGGIGLGLSGERQVPERGHAEERRITLVKCFMIALLANGSGSG